MRRLPLFAAATPAAVHEFAKASFRDILRRPRSAAVAAEIGRDVGAWAEEGTARARDEAGEPPLVCTAGCAWCCHLKFAVTAPEVIALKAHLDGLPDDIREHALERIVAVDAKTRGMSTSQRLAARIACPLLADGRCIAYASRPAACRAANSYDAAGCERALSEPTKAIRVANSPIAVSMCDATRGAASVTAMEAGLDGRLLELNAALRIAVERPNAAEQWSRGQPAFRFAVDAEIEAALRARRR